MADQKYSIKQTVHMDCTGDLVGCHWNDIYGGYFYDLRIMRGGKGKIIQGVPEELLIGEERFHREGD